ncbi:hypothetical protein D3C84_773680 [compost metagenome]
MGNNESPIRLVAIGAGAPLLRGITPKITSTPTTMKPRIAATLIPENQYSASPKARVAMALIPNSTTTNSADQYQIGTAGNQRVISMPAAVNSRPTVVAQLIQYTQPIMNPVAGPMYLVAWVWNEPDTGICTDSSPRQTITRYIRKPATR